MSGKDKVQQVIDLVSPTKPKFDGTPVRQILCVKSRMHIKLYEETEECFILDFDPFENVGLSKDEKLGGCGDVDGDVCVVAEKGQVACRDYPHSRDLCQKFPYKKTPRESYCELCYCYVCDSPAPCKYWTNAKTAHCNATGSVESWRLMRKERKKQAARK